MGDVRRVCPRCHQPLIERGTGLLCKSHGTTTTWLVQTSTGGIVGAGRAGRANSRDGGVWLSPRIALEDAADFGHEHGII